MDSNNNTCRPVTKILYAKTHKTGSTTVQNIILRFGVKNELTFAFPPYGKHVYRPTSPLTVSHLLRKTGVVFDVFACHGKWNLPELKRIIPDGATFTILREPLAAFESMYSYYRLHKRYEADVNDFALRFAAENAPRMFSDKHGKDNQLYDLGMPARYLESRKSVLGKIKRLDGEFELVMITEFFAESLILLRERLCWSFDDIAFIPKNSRKESRKKEITEEARPILERWLWAEYLLYDHFKRRFLKRVAAFGAERMEREKAELAAACARLEADCAVGGRKREMIECRILFSREIPTIANLRRLQERRLARRAREEELAAAAAVQEVPDYGGSGDYDADD